METLAGGRNDIRLWPAERVSAAAATFEESVAAPSIAGMRSSAAAPNQSRSSLCKRNRQC